VDLDRLRQAFQTAARDLLAERTPDRSHWVGQLSNSALSTATAISALSLAADGDLDRDRIDAGVTWLVARQNPDGGWGDTDHSLSNIATTMLVQAALHLAGRAAEYTETLAAADRYVAAQGGLLGLRRRYGPDKTFAVPILSNAALAGLVPWREVAPLPFELAVFPQKVYRFLQMPVVSYAIPALVAIGQLRYFREPPRNPLTRWYRSQCIEGSLRVLERMQPASGGYLEAIPLTSFVVMSLAGSGRADHPVARKGIEFLRSSRLADGSWPIDVDLATWGTTLSLLALAQGEPRWRELLDEGSGPATSSACLDWLLSCQHRERHPFTGADPGGWGWTDLSGAVPDADDTPGALLALAEWRRQASCTPKEQERIDSAARAGVDWLLRLQNDDGGWPTFCRGWGKLPFDRSGADLTAHALRALRAWRELGVLSEYAKRRIERAMRSGWNYLGNSQRADGSWIPLWFGNQHHPTEENPVYGTAKVLLAYCEAGKGGEPRPQKGLDWLARQLLSDREISREASSIELGENQPGSDSVGDSGGQGEFNAPRPRKEDAPLGRISESIEETALAVETLAASVITTPPTPARGEALRKGLDWLIRAVETRDHLKAAPIGLYFAKLWYYERLYPLAFTTAALGRGLAVSERMAVPTSETPTHPTPSDEPAPT
jgi:squalene-hopene/tetraprenyl-beta-curcumene cyclase